MQYKAQFKKHSPFESWTTSGSHGSEQTAISVALQKKIKGAILVRVIDEKGHVVYSG
jgi:hypothetical protein